MDVRSGGRMRVALLILLALVPAACGSTVPVAERQAAELSGDELGGDLTPALPSGAHVNKKGQVISAEGEVLGTAEEFGLEVASGSDEGSTEGVAPSGDSPEVTGGAGSGVVEAQAPGVTDTKIYFGIVYTENGPANQAAFGVSIDVDARQQYNAMIDYINKQGGLFGREVEPIYFKLDAASSQTVDQQLQSACAHWTEDNEVFGILEGRDVLQECAKRAGAINTSPFGATLPEDFRTYPHYFETSGLNMIRTGPVTVSGLDRQNYFGSEPKLGVVVWDDPAYRASLEQGYMPALEQKGISLATEPAYISVPETAQDLGATSADVNSTVLRFQAQGITHVLILAGSAGLCSNACLETLFLRRADSQEYFPRYGFNMNNSAKAALEEGLYPARQLRRSVAVEWMDADESYDEGWKLNKARERCYALMRDAGVPMDNTNKQFAAREACEQFWFFQTIESILGEAPLTADNFMVGVNKVGSSFQAPNAYAVHFSATQHDGVSAARNMKFDDSCTCYKWTSDPYRV